MTDRKFFNNLNMVAYGHYERVGVPIENYGISREFKFTSKPEYLSWVDNWKRDYGDLAAHIREQKAKIKRMQKDSDPDAGSQQSYGESLSLRARGMLVVRREGKKHSWTMKQQEVAV